MEDNAREQGRNSRLTNVDCSERSKFSRAGEVSDASNRVLYLVTLEEHLTSSSNVEDGVRSGTQEQGEIRERSVPGPAAELAEDEGDVEEEARTAKPLRDPRDPTAAERAIHEATHLPIRSWCAECVAGWRDNPPNHRVRQDENAVPEILMDCCFVRRDDEIETVTVLLMKDPYSAWVVERKGPDLDAADVAQRALVGLRKFGHRGRVLMKTDNEPAILSLEEEMMRRLDVSAILVESAPSLPPSPPPPPRVGE